LTFDSEPARGILTREISGRQPLQLVYDLLFRAATSTLLELGRDPPWLGAQLGITGVLYTWSRKLLGRDE
jgi:hypothetical protein